MALTRVAPYHTIRELLEKISEPNQSKCFRVLEDHVMLFVTALGSVHNHQAWPGGYMDHVREVMNIACLLHPVVSIVSPRPIILSDALLVLFFHDIEKPWKYEVGPDGVLRHQKEFSTKEDAHKFRLIMLEKYAITLTPEQMNALTYVEGEGDDYSNRERVMGPLAAFCHMCDVASARIRFNCPQDGGDPWPGAQRTY